jgi:hypothetical protein
MSDPGAVHEERSQKAADQLRAMLTALATAGMGAAYLVREQQRADLWRGSAASFSLALACVLISWFLVKHREVKRRNAKRHPELHPDPDPFPRWKRSWTWDRLAGGFLALGVVLLGIGFAA